MTFKMLEARALHEVGNGHPVGAEAVRGQRPLDLFQQLPKPPRGLHLFIVQVSTLVSQIDIHIAAHAANNLGGTRQMVHVRPTVIIIQEAEMGAGCLRCADVYGVALTVSGRRVHKIDEADPVR